MVSLGEVMLRLDPGDRRITTARTFEVCEGGGEYNVARGLKRWFGLGTAIVTAFADDPVGRLLQDFIYQGGVDQSLVRWVEHDGVGRWARNGLNFTERGCGMRAALGSYERGHTAVSQLKPGDIDWEESSASTEPGGYTREEFFAPFLQPVPRWRSKPCKPPSATTRSFPTA
jgi:2-dehydro-3-deoxygluconokinase